MKYLVHGIVLCAMLAVSATTTQAQTRRQRAQAREAYGRAQTLYAEGQYVEAEAAFREAFAVIPNPVVLIGVAEALERQNKVPETVAILEQYLELRADAPDRADIESRLTRLRATPGTVSVSSAPAGAAVLIDGQDSGEVTPAEFSLAPGEHTIGFRAEGYEPHEASVDVEFAAASELSAEMTALPEPEPEPIQVVEPPIELEEDGEDDDGDDEDEGVGTAVWVTSGIAAAGLVTGTVLGFLALSEESEFDAAPTDATADRGERYALFADVAFGVAAAGAITAIVLFLTQDSDDDDEEEEAGVTATVAPFVGAHEGGVSTRVEF